MFILDYGDVEREREHNGNCKARITINIYATRLI